MTPVESAGRPDEGVTRLITPERREYNRRYHAAHRDQHNAAAREYQSRNKEQFRTYRREYYVKNRNHIRAHTREYRAKNVDQLSAVARKHYVTNKDLRNAGVRDLRIRVRSRFFEIYGKECACCHVKEQIFLTVGHKRHDGKQDRLENGGQLGVIRRAVAHPDFEKYETQCYNCNMAALRRGTVIKPHSGAEKDRTRKRKYRAKLQSQFLEIYGEECVCCGERDPWSLTIGHPLADGHADRLEKGGWQAMVRRAIEHHNRTKYETQCFNCNLGAARNGGICPHEVQIVKVAPILSTGVNQSGVVSREE